jgi:tetratricopeptide (TPR) repeat protein
MADRRRLGLAYLNSGDSLTAYKTWQDAYRDSSEDLNNLNYIRITALQMGSMKPKMRVEAIEMCELWLANPQAPDEYKPAMYYTAGLHMLFLDSLDSELDTTNRALTRKSIEYFNKSIALDSQYVYAWFYMGDAYSRIDSTEKAIISFDEAIKICQSDTAKYSKSFTLIYNKLCGLHYTNKDWPALIDASTRWTVDEPKVEWGWLYLGIANYYAENNSAAKAALRKCISINPANKSAKGLLQQMEGAGK